MANTQQLAKLNEGFAAWNTWRASTNPSIDLTDASLDGKNFTNFDLHDANFERASLRRAKLSVGTEARRANFSLADLHSANLDGSDLSHATFNGADITDASFREASLRCADLSNVRGTLQQVQLAGADLTAAKLPESVSRTLTDLETLNALSVSARNLLFAVLAACLYCWLTIATTTDGNLITNHTSSPLPVIQASIPIVGFFIVAPLLLVCSSLYFHFYLQRLLEEVASLPAVFPDGRPLGAKVDAQLIDAKVDTLVGTLLMAELVNSPPTSGRDRRPLLSHIQLWVSVLLVWWAVPMTIFLFWARYLRRHEWHGTIFHIVTLTVTFLSAWCLTKLAFATLRRTERSPFRWKLILTNPRMYVISLVILAGLSLLGVVSLGAIRGNCNEDKPNHCPLDVDKLSTSTLIPALLSLIGYHPFPDLSDQDISVKGTNWTDKPDDPDDESRSVRPAKLKGWDLRNARMESVFLVGADLSNANLTNAVLVNANLRRVQLSDAKLAGANFFDADLRGANLEPVKPSRGPNLTGANTERVKLGPGPNLTGANLSQANLTKAVLMNTCLFNAHLVDAQLPDADLTDSDLTQADLSSANLSSATLENANLTHADLTKADLTDVSLKGADLKFADLRQIIGLTPGQIQSAKAWNDAFYDAGLLSSLGLETNHNEKLEGQLKKAKVRQPPCYFSGH